MISNQILKLSRVLLKVVGGISFLTTNVSYADTFTDDFELGHFRTNSEFNQTQAGDYGGPHVDCTFAKTGNCSARFDWIGAPYGQEHGAKLQYDLDRYINDEWLQFDVFFPTNWAVYPPPSNGSHNKIWVTWTDDYSTGEFDQFEAWQSPDWPVATVSYAWLNYGAQYIDAESTYPNGHYCRFPDVTQDLGRWTNFIFHIKISDNSTSNNGMFQIWRNGQLCLDKQGKSNYLRNGRSGINHMFIFGPQDMGFIQDTTVYIDNLTISTMPITYGGGSGGSGGSGGNSAPLPAAPMPPGVQP
jgi:hypothetical protein